MTTNSKVKKWGNSLAVRLPNSVAAAVGIADNTDVKITTEGQFVVITPLKKKAEMTAEDLFKAITPENVHPAIDWGPPVGKEIW